MSNFRLITGKDEDSITKLRETHILSQRPETYEGVRQNAVQEISAPWSQGRAHGP